MAVPKRKTSKATKRKRRTHKKLHIPGMTSCPNCGDMKLNHRICGACGHYNGKDVASAE